MRSILDPGPALVLTLLAVVLVAGTALGSGHREPAKAEERYRSGWAGDLLPDDPDRRLRVRVQANVTWYWDNLTLTVWSDRAHTHRTDVDPGISEARAEVAYRYPAADGAVEGSRNLTTFEVWTGETLHADLPEGRSLDLRLGGELAATVEDLRREGGLDLDVGPLAWNGSTAREAGDLAVQVPAAAPLGSRLQARLGTSLAFDVGATLEEPDGTAHHGRNATRGPVEGEHALDLGYEVANRPPRLAVEAPQANATVDGSLDVRGTASDPDEAVVAVEVRARAPGQVWAYDDPVVAGNWSTAIDVGEADGEEVSVTIRAVDGPAPPVEVPRNVTVALAEEGAGPGTGAGNGTEDGVGAGSAGGAVPGVAAGAAAAALAAAARVRRP